MAAFTNDQLRAATSELTKWKAVNPITTAERAEKIHEVFVAIGLGAEIVKRANATAGKPTVELLDRDEHTQSKFVPRTNPGVLGSKATKRYGLSPTFIRIRFTDGTGVLRVIEIHQSVRWLDRLGTAHEADVAVLGQSLPSYRVAVPVRTAINLSIECKLWRGRASLGSAREAEAFHYWLGTQVHVLAHSGPCAPSVSQFISAVGAGLFYFHDVGDPRGSATVSFFPDVLSKTSGSLGV